MAEKRDVSNAYERYEIILNLLEEKEDKIGKKMLNDLIKSILNYMEIVIMHIRMGKILKFRLEDKEYNQRMEEIGYRRTVSHNKLISDLHSLNRYLFKKYGVGVVPVGGVYSSNPESIRDRNAIAHWAGCLAEGLFRRNLIAKPEGATIKVAEKLGSLEPEDL